MGRQVRLLVEGVQARVALAAVLGAFAPTGGLDELQQAVFDGIAAQLYGLDLEAEPLRPLSAPELMARDPGPVVRRQAVHLMSVLEMVVHDLRPEVPVSIEHYAHAVGVDLGLLRDSRERARHHIPLYYADLQRSSWYTEQTIRASLHGAFTELVRSKIAYSRIAGDQAIATRWRSLRDCPPGSLGRGVADFYERHHFPFPGERGGIYEIGAKHDFVHVLTDYEATPEGEIDVFAFIAASMPDEKGLVLLAVTLGLFQNGAIHRVAGKRVKIARADTLTDPGAVDHFATALARGSACAVDVMGGIDHFALAPEPLEEVRARFNIAPVG